MKKITSNIHNWEDLKDGFLNQLDSKEKTKNTYKKSLKVFIKFLNETTTTTPTKETIIKFKKQLQNEGKKATTIQTYLIAVKVFFDYLENASIYPNIARKIKNVRIEKNHKKDFLNVQQCKELLNSIEVDELKGIRDFALLSLMITSGLRTCEIVGANVADIKQLNNEYVLFIQGKGRNEKSEYVKINNNVYFAINQYLNLRKKNNIENEALFVSTSNNNKNKRLTTRTIRDIVKKRLKAINIDSERMSAHSLRHTTATLNLLNGGTLEETKQLLRHSHINTTLIYAHSIDRLKNQSENRIASLIF